MWVKHENWSKSIDSLIYLVLLYLGGFKSLNEVEDFNKLFSGTFFLTFFSVYRPLVGLDLPDCCLSWPQ